MKSLQAAFVIAIVVIGFSIAGISQFGLVQGSASFTISGYILDSDGHGIAGAHIIFNVPDIVPSVNSDPSGYYEIFAPAGTYHVNVWPPFDSNYINYDELGFVVASDLTKNITLASGCKVSGYITDSLGAPVVGASVLFRDSANTFGSGWFSNSVGYYFLSVPAGTYTIDAHPRTAYGGYSYSSFTTEFPTYYEYNFVVNGNLAKNITVSSSSTPSPSPSPTPSPTTPKTVEANTIFNDNFDDGVADGWTPQVGSWSVINGEYRVSVGIVENGITTVNGLNLKDCTIETKLRFMDDIGYRAGIVFRYMGKDTYYELEVSNEYDCLGFSKYLPECPDYGTQNYGFGERTPAEIHFATGELKVGDKVIGSVPLATISKNVEYTLRVTITGNTFVGELIGGGINQKIVWEDTDNPFTYGTVGLRARRADAYFDNFRVFNATVAPSPTPTPTPSPAPMPNQSLQTYSDDFSADSGAWQYLGSAYRDPTNQYLVLTPSGNEAAGVAFFKAPIQGSFTANFRYKSGGGNSGDGFTLFFYKQGYPSTIDYEDSFGANGASGCRLGFNSLSIIPGYGIEFDGWQNIPEDFQQVEGGQQNPQGDPSANHIALIKDFSGNHLTYVNDERVADDNWHQVTIEVQASSVKVFVDQELVLQWTGVLDRTYAGFGFSGATGGVGSNWHIIDDFSINAHNLQKPSLTVSCRSSTSYSGFNVKIEGSLTLNETGISGAPILLSYSVTGGKSWEDLTLVYTGSDGSYSATWLPSVTGNYLLKATYEGDADTLGVTSEIVNFAVTDFAEKNVLFSVSSNSTVTSLAFNSTTSELSFTVSGPSETTGYVKAAIAKSLVSNAENIVVYLDGKQLNYEITSNADSWLLDFTYTHSTHQVMISLAANAATTTFLGIENWIWVSVLITIVMIGAGLLVYFETRFRPE